MLSSSFHSATAYVPFINFQAFANETNFNCRWLNTWCLYVNSSLQYARGLRASHYLRLRNRLISPVKVMRISNNIISYSHLIQTMRLDLFKFELCGNLKLDRSCNICLFKVISISASAIGIYISLIPVLVFLSFNMMLFILFLVVCTCMSF